MAQDAGGTWTRAGAVVSAALASMCCILPLGLGALGLSTTVVAAFFEPLRPWFLALAGALLGLGLYFALRTTGRRLPLPRSPVQILSQRKGVA